MREARDEIEAWRGVRVELLRDGKGVYGVGTVGLADPEAQALDYH